MTYTSQEEHDPFEGAAEQSVPQKPMTYTEKRLEEVLKIAVDRFLGWKLPKDFQPDGGISFKSGVCETIGTHLFTAQQANEMLKYVLEEALATSIAQAVAEERERVKKEIEKKVEKYKQKACVLANSFEYDEVNMLMHIERPELRRVVNTLMDAKRDFSDLLSSLDRPDK